MSDEYLMTHILAGLRPKYSSVVDHAKIDLRKHTLNLFELKKRLKEKYMQLKKEKGWGDDEMTHSASQNNGKVQKKGINPRFKGRCNHCGKWGNKKEQCREWLKLTKEQQDQADKERSEHKTNEKPRKYMQQVRCYNCNKIGHIKANCPEKKTRESHVDSGGGFAMVCLEDGQSLVEEPFQLVHNQQLQLNLEETSEENLEDDDLEQHLELPWSLKEWISHMNCCQHHILHIDLNISNIHFIKVELKFEIIPRIQQLVKKLSSEQNLIFY